MHAKAFGASDEDVEMISELKAAEGRVQGLWCVGTWRDEPESGEDQVEGEQNQGACPEGHVELDVEECDEYEHDAYKPDIMRVCDDLIRQQRGREDR